MQKPDGRYEDAPSLLVGIANPDTIPNLMQLAASIVLQTDGRLVATHIVTVPPQAKLESARASPQVAAARKLLLQAIRTGAQEGVRVRGVVEVAREVHEGLVSAASNQGAELVLVGLSDVQPGPDRAERAFDRIMHRVARQTSSDLVVAKFRGSSMSRVLVPIAGDVNLRVTGLIVRALAERKHAVVRFLHVAEPGTDTENAVARISALLAEHELDGLGELRVVSGDDSLSVALAQVNEHDLTIVGASSRPSLAESVFGSWAERLATQAERTVLLVRAKHATARSAAGLQ
jgi:nucleotide-binding universal stress UspA family protein